MTCGNAGGGPFVVIGNGHAGGAGPGTCGVRLPPGDAFASEELLIVLGDQAPAAIFARASAGGGLYEVVITQDSELVHEIARHIIRRVPGSGPENTALGGPAPEEESAVEEAATSGHAPKRGWRE